MKNKELISDIRKKVLHEYPDAEIFLFGSFARGDERPDSDLDLLILIDKAVSTRIDQKTISALLYDLELGYHQVISPLIRTKTEWYTKYPNTPLFKNINREGVKI